VVVVEGKVLVVGSGEGVKASGDVDVFGWTYSVVVTKGVEESSGVCDFEVDCVDRTFSVDVGIFAIVVEGSTVDAKVVEGGNSVVISEAVVIGCCVTVVDSRVLPKIEEAVDCEVWATLVCFSVEENKLVDHSLAVVALGVSDEGAETVVNSGVDAGIVELEYVGFNVVLSPVLICWVEEVSCIFVVVFPVEAAPVVEVSCGVSDVDGTALDEIVSDFVDVASEDGISVTDRVLGVVSWELERVSVDIVETEAVGDNELITVVGLEVIDFVLELGIVNSLLWEVVKPCSNVVGIKIVVEWPFVVEAMEVWLVSAGWVTAIDVVNSVEVSFNVDSVEAEPVVEVSCGVSDVDEAALDEIVSDFVDVAPELPMDVLDSVGIGFEGVVGTSEVVVFAEEKDIVVGLSVENRVEGGL
jgi:hypothetical protein